MHPLFKGALFLTVASALSKLIGSLFRIPMQNIAGDELLGIFSIVYPIYMLTLTLSVAGIPLAVSKLISEKRMLGSDAAISSLFHTARSLAIIFGVSCFLAIWLFAAPLSSLLGGEQVRFALVMVSATLIIAPYMAVYRGYFQGFEMMHQTAISQIIEQVFRVGIMLLIVSILVELDVSYPRIAGWMMIGSFLGAGISLLYLFIAYRRQPLITAASSWKRINWAQWKADSTSLLSLAIPIAFGSISFSLIPVIDSLTMPYGLQQFGIAAEKVPYTFGIYSRGIIFIQVITMIASSLVTPIIPHLARMREAGNPGMVEQTVTKVVSIVQLTAWPVVILSALLITPLNIALFTNTSGNSVMIILIISGGFLALAMLSTGILQALGYEKQAAGFVCIAIGSKVIGNLIFLPMYGLVAAASVTLFSYGLLVFFNFFLLKRHLNVPLFSVPVRIVFIVSLCLGLIFRLPMSVWEFGSNSRIEALLYSLAVGIFLIIIIIAALFIWRQTSKRSK